MGTHTSRARRSLARLAAALGLGLGLLAASATASSANCGAFVDPWSGAVIEIPCAVELYQIDPEPPCFCPYTDLFVDPRVLTFDLGSLFADASAFASPGDSVTLNPQPLPPRAFAFALR